jgi:hypothetical protein
MAIISLMTKTMERVETELDFNTNEETKAKIVEESKKEIQKAQKLHAMESNFIRRQLSKPEKKPKKY